MRSIVVRGVTYSEISATALTESQFERLVLQHSGVIAPGAHVVPFKCDVSDGTDSRQADLAVIHGEYAGWSVIEVEMWDHSLRGHVLPQISVLKNGRYTLEHANYLFSKAPHLDGDRLADMVKGEQPDVVVMVNRIDERWLREVRSAGCRLSLFEMYASPLDEFAFLVDGPLLRFPEHTVTTLTCDAGALARFLTVGSPALLGIRNGESLTASVDGKLIKLERFDFTDRCVLKTVGPITLQPGQRYRLVQSGSSFTLERITGSEHLV